MANLRTAKLSEIIADDNNQSAINAQNCAAADKKYVGIRAQVERAINNALAQSGTSLLTYEFDVEAARRRDLERTRNGVKAKSEAIKLASAPRYAFRRAFKEVLVKRALAALSEGKAGVFAAFDAMEALHTALQAALLRVKQHVIKWDDFQTDIPVWETWTLVGHDADGNALFEKSELWSFDELRQYAATSAKFGKDLSKWIIEAQLETVPAPVLQLPNTVIGEAIQARLLRSLEAKRNRDVQDGREEWAMDAFYFGGMPPAELKTSMHIMTVLAAIGRVVLQTNREIESLNYLMGDAITPKPQRKGANTRAAATAGLEKSDREVRIHDHYALTISTDNLSAPFYAEDANFRHFVTEVEDAVAAVQKWVAEWEYILPRHALRRMDVDFNGGFEYLEASNTFRALKLEFTPLAFEFDADAVMRERDRRRAYAIEQEAKALDNFKPQALAF